MDYSKYEENKILNQEEISSEEDSVLILQVVSNDPIQPFRNN